MVIRRGILLIASLVFGCAVVRAAHPALAQPPFGPAPIDGSMNPPQDSDTTGTAPQTSDPASAVPSGTVLASDTFSDPSSGLMATSAPPNLRDRWNVGYTDGEFRIGSVGIVSGRTIYTASIRGEYSDVSLAVDARVVGGPDAAPDQAVQVSCRAQADDVTRTGYRLTFAPLTNEYSLRIEYPDRPPEQTAHLSTPIAGTSPHHLQLTCAGTAITASIDGQQVASIQDSTYSRGRATLGISTFFRVSLSDPTCQSVYQACPNAAVSRAGTWDARFANLVLAQP
jgi:hypothetical protein